MFPRLLESLIRGGAVVAALAVAAGPVPAQPPGPIGQSTEWEATGFNNGRRMVRDSNGYFHAVWHAQAGVSDLAGLVARAGEDMVFPDAVGALAAFGLWLAGVRSSLILGLVIGILNLIPYFGPVLGAIPAVAAALTSGWQTALFAGLVLIVVQQLDGMIISPRIMGNITGLSPAAVLIAVFVGGCFKGILGMLVALPVLMVFRTCVRVFVQRTENI